MTDRLRRAGSLCWAIVGVVALLMVLGTIAWVLRVVFPPLILAGAIVFVLNPGVTRLAQRGVPRAIGAAVAYLVAIGVVVASGFLLAPVANDQYTQLIDDWPDIRARGEEIVDDLAADSKGTPFEFSRRELENQFGNANAPLRDQLERAAALGETVFHFLLIIVLAPIIAFYLLVDVPHLRHVAVELIPEAAKDEVLAVSDRLNRAIGGYFRGQLLVALIVGIVCSAGLGIIGLRFWFLIGMIAGVFNLVPLIGPWIGGIPGVAIALTTGSPLQAIGVVGIMAAVQQIDNHFITPQVMQRAVHLHPAAVMLALLAGGTLGGFFGLLLAVPAAAVLKILIGHVWRVHVLGEPIEIARAEELAADAASPGVIDPVIERGSSLDADEEHAPTGT